MEKYKVVNPSDKTQVYGVMAKSYTDALRKVRASLSPAINWVVYNVT